MPTDILDAIEAQYLPLMPQVLVRFLRAVDDDRASLADLAVLVKQDPALCARILTAANTPARRLHTELPGIEAALQALGRRQLQVVAACLAAQGVFGSAAERRPYALDGYWVHSLQVAELARRIAEQIDYANSEEAYLAGLLHDIGELLLLGGLGDRYGAMLNWCRDEHTLLDLEFPELGTDHAEVGAWLADRWQLPSFIADAVLFHHRSPTQIGGADLLSRLVWCAHVSLQLPAADQADMASTMALADAAEHVGLAADTLQTLTQAARDAVTALAQTLDIPTSADHCPLPASPEAPFEAAQRLPADPASPHAQLEAAVCDMAILQPLQKCMSTLDDDAELLQALRESIRILFGVNRSAFFLQLPGATALSGARIGHQADLIQRLEIPLKPGHSVAAATCLERTPVARFTPSGAADVALTDVQIARALDSERVLYLPMIAHQRLIGLMVLGISNAHESHLAARMPWLQRFTQVAANSIERWRSQREREAEIEAAIASRFELQGRKVVHEAGNPLAIIRNYLKIVSQKLPPDIEVHQELDILKEEIDRVAQIVRRLSNLATDTSANGSVDVNTLIESMLVLYGESLFASHNIAVDLHLSRALTPLAGNRDSIKQILLNLWKNAAEAMADQGGKFSILTRDGINQNGQMYLEIRLSDSGPGLPADVMAQLYRPLPGNRRDGHSGLGLSIVASLVEQLRGHITCQSESGKGTSYSILLPQSARSEA